MDGFVITHRLDLAVHLLDTTTGRPVPCNAVRFSRNGDTLRPLEKERGLGIFPGLGRYDFTLRLDSHSYEDWEIPVSYETLDEKMPLLEVQLIPISDSHTPVPCLGIEGVLPGISGLTAVRVGDSACFIRGFEPPKKQLTLFNPHHLDLERTHYALVNPNTEAYERFQISRILDDGSIEIDRILEMEFENNFPIAPVVFGKTRADGSYLLRVRDFSAAARWLVSYRWREQTYFQTVDLRLEHTLTPPQSPQIQQRE
ncbi:MAG: hypothetical protein RR426_02325 [Oscillospiraceae bacterium]